MRSAARHRCSTCVAACSLSGLSSKKPFKPWESAIHVNSAPMRCLRHLLNAHRPTEASPVWEWYDCSAPDVEREMHETAHRRMPWVCSSKKHGPPCFSSSSARVESLSDLACKKTDPIASLHQFVLSLKRWSGLGRTRIWSEGSSFLSSSKNCWCYISQKPLKKLRSVSAVSWPGRGCPT